MDNNSYAVVDLETTGHSSAKGDRIIQIAIVFIKDGEIGEKYVRFVNPGQRIPAFIQQLTSITEKDVEHAPYFDDIAKEVSTLLEGCIFVAHNTDFDLSFLQNEFARCGIPKWIGKKIDTVELAKIMFPSSPSYRLQDITEELGITLKAAHRADDDAEATAHLYLACMTKMHTLPEQTLKLLHSRSFHLKSDLASLFYETLKNVRKKRPSKQMSAFRGIPFRHMADEPLPSGVHPLYPQDIETKMKLFKKAFPTFERRDSQFRFMDAVWNAFIEHHEIIAEVPTGIGKTAAYLVPASIHALVIGKPVVISTYTNHLVDKIMYGELDKINAMLGVNIKATVIKGMEQYISLGKLEELLRISDESYDETFTIMQILVWLTETNTGDLGELTVSGGGQLFVDRLRKRSNRLTQDEEAVDFHNKLINSCQSSNLIITNHAMLISDISREQVLFKSFAGIVVDEAHQFVQTATRLNEITFSYMNWKYVLGQIGSDAEGQLLYHMEILNKKFGTSRFRAKEQLDAAFNKFTTYFDFAINDIVSNKPISSYSRHGNRIVYALDELDYTELPLHEVATALYEYIRKADAFIEDLIKVLDSLSKNEQAMISEWQYWVRELTIKAGEWVEIFLENENNLYTVWIEKDKRSLPGSLTIIKSPIDGTAIIRKFIEKLSVDRKGIVWTSGTLSIHGNERFIAQQLGIDEAVPVLKFDAPKHFYEGAEIFLVENMPDIQQVSQSEYIEAVADAVSQTVMATGGKLFALFTSQDMLRKTYELINESEQLEEYALFAQGVTSGGRLKLLKSFRQFEKSVLFGTNSFWEGVDVPGEALKAVIIVRLPFSSPEEPVFKARATKMTAEGLNPFTDYSLPEAVMRLRQGFGRLIRASSDKGFFIILDRRIETKSYGKQFLDSLPDVPVKKVSIEHMVKELENCYNK